MSTAEANKALEAAKRALATETMESLEEGVSHLERAAKLGNAEAMTQLAHFIAAGVSQPADWDRSANLLKDAAERGSGLALDELRVLAGGDAAPATLRANLDFRAAIAPRPAEVVRDSPRIRCSRNFLTRAECQWIITRGRSHLSPATVYEQKSEGSKRVDQRSNSAAAFRLLNVDLPLVLIHTRMAATVGLPMPWFEPSALLHYSPGQQFEPHYDFLDPKEPGYLADLRRRGQRIATLLVYLNEDFEGGETDFPDIPYRFKGKTGDLLVFANTLPEGLPDRKTRHAGLPPTRGEKWLLSQWVRDRPM